MIRATIIKYGPSFAMVGLRLDGCTVLAQSGSDLERRLYALRADKLAPWEAGPEVELELKLIETP